MKNIKKNIKYFVLLFSLLTLFICVGNMVMAEENEVSNEEVKIIAAEEIGIETVGQQEVEIIEEHTDDENISEGEDMDVPIQNEEDEEVKESEDIYESPEANPIEKPETNEVTDNMVEGYEEGSYFEPNYFECEIEEECYKCDECIIEEDVFCDEEINPRDGHYVLDRQCIVCGHGSCVPVDDNLVPYED